MDIEEFRKAGYNAIDRICDYYYGLQKMPVKPAVKPGYLADKIPGCAPEKGEHWEEILSDYTELIVPGLTNWQHPSFFGFFPIGCTLAGTLADLLSTSACNPGFNWTSSPASTELEVLMMDWAADLLGLSKDFRNSSGRGGGVIQTTACDSALIAAFAARTRYQRTHPDVKHEDLVLYVTTQTHSLGIKAGKILGIDVRALEVEASDRYALRGHTLERALEEDLSRGKHPFILMATLGTTSSGAFDNMKEIGDVAKNHPSLWIHIDAAWAGIALVCPEYRDLLYLNEINESATSFCTNFHKWGLVNFDCSAFWVRDRKLLTETLDVTPPFLRTKESETGLVVDYRNWHLGLARRFRSLKLWFVFRSYGVGGFQSYIRRCVNMNDSFQQTLSDIPTLSLVTPPSLSLSVFRIPPEAVASDGFKPTLETMNSINQAFFARLSARRDILMTQTMLNGVFCVRFVVGSERTKMWNVYDACDILRDESIQTIEDWNSKYLPSPAL